MSILILVNKYTKLIGMTRYVEENLLQLILDYKMTRAEARAWKIAILYLHLAKKYFPDYEHYKPGKRDPRKTSLFRHCYKLLRETDLDDYRLYITAQMQIMKNIDYGTGGHAFIGPNCLTGVKAWKRWLLWRNKFYGKIKAIPNAPQHSDNKIIAALANTKKFLSAKFELTSESITASLNNRNLFRWCALGDVSGYYLVHSPLVSAWCSHNKTNLLEAFAIDLGMFKVTEESKVYFHKEFNYEFAK